MSGDAGNDDGRTGVSPTVALIAIAALVALAIIGATLIIAIRPEASTSFSNTIIIILGIAVSFAGTVGIVAPIARKTTRVEKAVKVVEKQTNGTLSAKDAEISRLNAMVVNLGGNPHE